jgi:hypothetical protein
MTMMKTWNYGALRFSSYFTIVLCLLKSEKRCLPYMLFELIPILYLILFHFVSCNCILSFSSSSSSSSFTYTIGSPIHLSMPYISYRYMMGVASLSCSPPDTDSARYHLEIAKGMMDKLLENSTEEVSRVHWRRVVPYLMHLKGQCHLD